MGHHRDTAGGEDPFDSFFQGQNLLGNVKRPARGEKSLKCLLGRFANPAVHQVGGEVGPSHHLISRQGADVFVGGGNSFPVHQFDHLPVPVITVVYYLF